MGLILPRKPPESVTGWLFRTWSSAHAPGEAGARAWCQCPSHWHVGRVQGPPLLSISTLLGPEYGPAPAPDTLCGCSNGGGCGAREVRASAPGGSKSGVALALGRATQSTSDMESRWLTGNLSGPRAGLRVSHQWSARWLPPARATHQYSLPTRTSLTWTVLGIAALHN